MGRLRVFVAVLMVALSGLGARAFGAEARCAETCPDDDDQGNCPPTCMDCTCCSHAPTVVRSSPTLLRLTPVVVLDLATDDSLPPSADLHELLDVPKSLAG